MDNIEAKNWVNVILHQRQELEAHTNKEVIIAPSFTFLSDFSKAFMGTNIKIAAQNLSPFDEGAYTGEVNAKQIKDFATYVIIGHSERRSNFKETDEILESKVSLAIKYGLTPIYCVQDEKTRVPQGVKIIAYEPIFAIGSGTPDTPENAQEVYNSFVSKDINTVVLYGGSVTAENINSFTKNGKIKGALVGGASLNPLEFIKIIKNA